MMGRSLLVISAMCALGANACKGKPDEPATAPALDQKGELRVPDGFDMQYGYDGKRVHLAWSWATLMEVEGAPALVVDAKDGRVASLRIIVAIPPHTPSVESMKGNTLGARERGLTMGNAPEMAIGRGGTVVIDDVQPSYIAGSFEAQFCPTSAPCDSPKTAKGTFKAYRSALSDTAAFARLTR